MRCVAARFGVLVGLGVAVGLTVSVGTGVFVAVGLGVEVLVGAGVANVEQADDRKSSRIRVKDKVSRTLLRCIYPPWYRAVLKSGRMIRNSSKERK
jgi:hypothetical protein